MERIELYNDSFQNWKKYLTCKAQLIIADPPYNLSREPYEIKPGDRIAQLVVSPCVRAKWEEVESLNTTGRNGGFGSTGK